MQVIVSALIRTDKHVACLDSGLRQNNGDGFVMFFIKTKNHKYVIANLNKLRRGNLSFNIV